MLQLKTLEDAEPLLDAPHGLRVGFWFVEWAAVCLPQNCPESKLIAGVCWQARSWPCHTLQHTHNHTDTHSEDGDFISARLLYPQSKNRAMGVVWKQSIKARRPLWPIGLLQFKSFIHKYWSLAHGVNAARTERHTHFELNVLQAANNSLKYLQYADQVIDSLLNSSIL